MKSKKLLAIILSFALMCSPITSVYAYDADVVLETVEVPKVNATSGTCGDSLTWSIDGEGTLTISGTGNMTNYTDPSYVPWYSDSSAVRSVVVEDGVTSIGDFAFSSFENLVSVTIGRDVSSIGDFAIFECLKLTSIAVDDNNEYYSNDEYGVLLNKDKTTVIQYPAGNKRTSYTVADSVTNIGNGAFAYASSLTSATVSDNVTSIGEGAFIWCEGLTNVTLGSKVERIEYGAFAYCLSLTSVEIPNSVTFIGDHAFSDCYSLMTVTLSDNLSNIGEGVFYWCESLTSIVIGDGVTNIEYGAFANCSSLTAVTIPNSVTSISEFAFGECSSLEYVWYNGTEDSWNDISIGSDNDHLLNSTIVCSNGEDDKIVESGTCGDNLTFTLTFGGTLIISGTGDIPPSEFSYMHAVNHLIIEDGVTGVGEEAFMGCSGLKTVTIAESVANIDNYAFFNCPSLEFITVDDNSEYFANDESGILYNKTATKLILCPANNGIVNYTIPDGVIGIENGAFAHSSTLVTVIMPDGITSIGNSAFANCSNLTGIIIPDNTTYIGDNAFASCLNVTSVDIPENVTQIGSSAFLDCLNLTDITVSENNEYYSNDEYNVLYSKDKTTLIYYPAGNARTSYTISEDVTSICGYAFNGCSHLTDIYYTGSVVDWGNISIGTGNDSLSDVTMHYQKQIISVLQTGTCGDNVTFTLYDNGEFVVSGSGNMTDFSSSSNVPWHNNRLSIKKIIVQDGVTSVGEGAFEDCTNLTTVTLSDSVTSIGDGGFFWCESISSFEMGNGIISIGNYAFFGCSDITSLSMPESLASIGDNTFMYCSNLDNVYYAGSEDDWNNIKIGSNNYQLQNATITYGKQSVTAVGIVITAFPETQYYYGEDMSLEGMTVVEKYSDGSSVQISEYTVTGYDKYSFGQQFITVSYGDFSCEFKVYVRPIHPTYFTAPITEGMTVEEFSMTYSELYTVYVFDTDKKTQLTGDDIMKTGCLVQLISDNTVTDSFLVIVNGDVTGDGIVNGKDLIRIKKQILEGGAVEYLGYADINCDGVVDQSDLDCLASMI